MTTKARLCARGFEEDKFFRTDSPTSTREGLRMVLATIASQNWSIKSIDVKAAFLQGNSIARDVFIRPPIEAKTTRVWKLQKCVYGLNDASRHWYLRLREELTKLNATPSNLDQGTFLWFDNQDLIGILTVFVDDIIFAGTAQFHRDIITKLKKAFSFGPESSDMFTYIGINIIQNEHGISIDQNNYTDTLKLVPISSERLHNKCSPVDEVERKNFRTAVGQLNWVSGISHPDISFHTCVASTKTKTATINDIILVNKVIQQINNTPCCLLYPKLDRNTLYLLTFTDASFNNLPNGGSQGGHIVLLCDDNGNCAAISWHSARIKRVVRSTLAAETVALMDGCDSSFLISKMIEETLMTKYKIESHVVTDNMSLYNTVHTTHLVDDKRLRVELSAIRQLVSNNEVHIHWTENQNQFSDVLTKRGASNKAMLHTLQCGKTPQY